MGAVNTQSLAFQVDGDESLPVLVLLHPIATNSNVWSAQMSTWAAKFRVVRIDLPGHGASSVPTEPLAMSDYARSVCVVLDTLSVSKASFVGLSLGGMVAQAIALDAPRRVERLVLAHTGARTTPEVRAIWQTRLDQFRTNQCRMSSIVDSTIQRWFTPPFISAAPMTIDFIAGQIRSTSAIGYETAVKAIQNLDHSARLKDMNMPTLVVTGSEDTAITPTVAGNMAASIPGAKLITLNGAAHLGNVQMPIDFTERVGAFLLE